jgi:hypothetical protein
MNMKKIISFFIVACCAMCATAAKVVWQIGVADNSGTELALGPSEYKKFLAHDFGYEDRYFLVGTSVDKNDFPYVLPGTFYTQKGPKPVLFRNYPQRQFAIPLLQQLHT